jgi:isopentenyl-diphosphate delta-isomerase
MEQVVLVDKEGNDIGVASKLEAHKKGLLHRAFSIFVFNERDEVLLQQRAFDKYHSGRLWSNTCCSHPRPGESLDQAVHRRLQEEMGFDCDLQELFTFRYKQEFDNGLIEHEYDHVFRGYYDGEVNPDPAEVARYKWVSWDFLVGDAKNNQSYTYWLREIIKLWRKKA